MSEPLRKSAPPLAKTAVAEPLIDLMPAVVAAEDNDNASPPAPREGERRGFEIPTSLWWGMVSCYGVFLAALLAATGSSGHAVFMIVVSLVYVIMFFGTTKLMTRQAPPQPRSPLETPARTLPTIYGPLRRGEVAAQMLVVPMAIAFFGVAILIIRTAVM